MAQSLIVLLLAVTIAGAPRPTSAGQPCTTVQDCSRQINQDKQKQQDLARKIAALKASAASLQAKQEQVKAVIASLKVLIDAKTADVNAAQAEADRVSAELAATTLRLEAKQQQLATDKSQLARELVVIYELQDQSTALNDLINGGSFNDFFTAVVNSRRISDYEKRTVAQINEDKNQIQTEVDTETSQEQQKQAALARVSADLAQLDADKASEQDALRYYAQLQTQAEQAEQQAEAASRALDAAISQLTQQRNKLGSGRLVWPNDGPISQGFGCNTYPFEPYDTRFCHYPLHFHNGLDIAGPCWSNVVAADTGIAYPQPFMSYGYGNWILVDHGAGMVTLYGHLNRYAVSYGQFVNRGQLIGYEGSTGNSTGCHVHFSVFINDLPVNPIGYLPSR